MKAKVLILCVGCTLVGVTTSAAAEPTEAPAILSALGNQAGVTIVSEADLAQIEGTGPLPFWSAQWRAQMRAFMRARRIMRLRMIRARLWYLRGGGGGGGEVPEGGGDDIPDMPPE